MSKIHMICGTSPNESDTQGDEYYLCGTEGGNLNDTYDARFVDCKKCLKRLNTKPGVEYSE